MLHPEWKAKRDRFLALLDPLEPEYKSVIANYFLNKAREGEADPVLICRNIYLEQWHYRAKHPERAKDKQHSVKLMEVMENPEHRQACLDYAKYAAWWASLSLQEAQKLRAHWKNEGKPSSQFHKERWAKEQPPTEKQLQMLRSLGCRETPANLSEASQWIDARLKERGRKAQE